MMVGDGSGRRQRRCCNFLDRIKEIESMRKRVVEFHLIDIGRIPLSWPGTAKEHSVTPSNSVRLCQRDIGTGHRPPRNMIDQTATGTGPPGVLGLKSALCGILCMPIRAHSRAPVIRFLIEGYPSVQMPPALRPAQGGWNRASSSRARVRAEPVEA